MKMRKRFLVNIDFQIKFIFKFCLIVVIVTLIMGALLLFMSRNFTTVVIEDAKVVVKRTIDFLLPLMLETLLVAIVLASTSVFILTLIISHKFAGPIHRFKKEISALKDGNLNVNFRIRANDQFQDLAKSLSELVETLREKKIFLKDKWEKFKEGVYKLTSNNEEIVKQGKEIDEILSYFK
ncbi:MAG: methyl-accepting chemotaxis protein [Candidatus Omnitrophica bacterium]|nr:methyl-accepting chemotaxis protein [Candidatus Omnitrophota bacterium]